MASITGVISELSSISEDSTYGVEGEDLPPSLPRRRRSRGNQSSASGAESNDASEPVESLVSITEETPQPFHEEYGTTDLPPPRPFRRSSTGSRSGSRRDNDTGIEKENSDGEFSKSTPKSGGSSTTASASKEEQEADGNQTQEEEKGSDEVSNFSQNTPCTTPFSRELPSTQQTELRQSGFSLKPITDVIVVQTEPENGRFSGESSNKSPDEDCLLTPYTQRKRSSVAKQRLAELTINKLKIHSMGLVGRSNEVFTLKNCFSRMMSQSEDDCENDTADALPKNSLVQSHVNKELCFIRGFSGVGKTRLAHALEQEVEDYDNGVFVEGKFDMNNTGERPYSALAKAFGALLRELRIRHQNDDIAYLIGEAIGSTVGALISLIPELGEFDLQYHTTSWNDTSDLNKSLDRWKFAFRCLTRVLSSKLSPLVIVLDDLQWADMPSLEMIQHLITDIQNTNPLMIIGCYRSNEVDSYSVLTIKRNDLQGLKTKYGFNITDIELESCQPNDVNEIIMAMMSIDDPSISKDLADLCFKRTMGNPFFLIEFMKMLQREELLSFSLGLTKWIWDIAKIEEKTVSTLNVAMLLQARMRDLSKDVQQLLQLATCLGQIFRVSTLFVLWRMRDVSRDEDEVVDEVTLLLAEAEGEMLIEMCGDNMYQWVHDTVQEAALQLDNHDLKSLQFWVGRQLLHNLDQALMEEDLFVVTDLINGGNEKEDLEFAELNLRAAKKARSLSAFEASKIYAEKGIDMLPSNVWETEYSMALELYTIGTQMELISGNTEKADEYSNKIFSQETFSVTETFPLRIARAWTLSTIESKHSEAADYVVQLLEDLDYKILWHPALLAAQAITVFKRTVKKIKNLPKDFFKAIGRVTDPQKKAISDLLILLNYSAGMSARIMLSVLSVCKEIEFSMKHGITDNAARSLSILAAFVNILQGDYETVIYLNECAFAVQDVIGDANKGRTMEGAWVNSLTWAKPIASSLTPLAEAYALCLRAGQTDFAMWALQSFVVVIPYILGKQLKSSLEECEKALKQIEEAGRADHIVSTTNVVQMMRNLHRPDNRQSLDSLDIPESWKSTKMYIGSAHYARTEELFFSDIEAAADLSLESGNLLFKCLPATSINMIHKFHQAVSLYAMAGRTKRRKYKVAAKRLRKIIQKWSKAGNPNVSHYLMILDAEDAALRKDVTVANENYQKAIIYAGRTGEMHHAGMFNERYAEFLLDVCGDAEEAKYRIQEAIRYYEEWRAPGKVDEMQEKYDSL
mmetsp:Transcript_13096/g.31000  ORF Transcript_13096/g.31000 Transcript_13096/m.31000 type:complete len:1255 (+) Transcript_13096:109-3873(+)